MGLITGIILFYIIFIVLKSFRDNRKTKEVQRTRKNSGNRMIPAWIEQWLDDREFSRFFRNEEEGIAYMSDFTVPSGRLNMIIKYNTEIPQLIVEIAYPVSIPKEKLLVMRRLVKELNSRMEGCHLILNREQGKLYFSYKNQNAENGMISRQDAALDIDSMIDYADECFPEIMKVLYGSSFPELAAIKIFGFQDMDLN